MRSALIVLALVAGCAQSAQDEMRELEDSTEIECWNVGPSCAGVGYQVSTDQALACMNDALAAGRRAEASWSIYDSKGYTTDTHVFTTNDHRVRIFISYPH